MQQVLKPALSQYTNLVFVAQHANYLKEHAFRIVLWIAIGVCVVHERNVANATVKLILRRG